MRLTLLGIFLVVLGVIYIRHPTMFRRGIWLRTSIAVRTLSEENYKKYMKGIGALLIVVGICLVAWEQVIVRFAVV